MIFKVVFQNLWIFEGNCLVLVHNSASVSISENYWAGQKILKLLV